MQKCPVCNQNEAKRGIYGIEPCPSCQTRRSFNSLPDKQIEFITEDIKTQRREYWKSTIQPYRSGQLSREYLQAFGVKGINPTAEEANKAVDVWSDLPGYENRDKTK